MAIVHLAGGLDGMLASLAPTILQYLNPAHLEGKMNARIAADESTARSGVESRVKESLAARGIDPSSPFAAKAINEAWAPYAGQFASARAGAGVDAARQLFSLAPMLLAAARRDQGGAGGGGAAAGWGGAPAGAAMGTITNPGALSGGWNHMPSGGWNDMAGMEAMFKQFAQDPNASYAQQYANAGPNTRYNHWMTMTGGGSPIGY